MVLQPQGCLAVFLVERKSDVLRRAKQGNMIKKQDTVVDHRNVGRNDHASVFAKAGRRVDDVVRLPFSGLLAGVGHRDMLLVDGAGLAVDVRLVFIVVEYLDFITLLQKHATVATPLTNLGGVCHLGRAPFNVKLHVAERFFRPDVSCSGSDRYGAVFDSPLSLATAVDGNPLAQVASIEQHDGIRGCVRGRSAGCNDFWLRFPDLGGFRGSLIGLREARGAGKGQGRGKMKYASHRYILWFRNRLQSCRSCPSGPPTSCGG